MQHKHSHPPIGPAAQVMIQTWRRQMASRDVLPKAVKERLPHFMGLLPMSKGRAIVPLSEFSLMAVVPVRSRTDVYCIRGEYQPEVNETRFDKIVMHHNLLAEPGPRHGRRDRHHDRLRTFHAQADWLQSALIVHEEILRAAMTGREDLWATPSLPRVMLGFRSSGEIPFVDTLLLREVVATIREQPPAVIDAMPATERAVLLEQVFRAHYVTAPGEGNRTGLFLVDSALLGAANLSVQAPAVFIDCREQQTGAVLPHPFVVKNEAVLFGDIADYRTAGPGLSDQSAIRAWAGATDEEIAGIDDPVEGRALREAARKFLDKLTTAVNARAPGISKERARGAFLAGQEWVGVPSLATAGDRIHQLREATRGLYPSYAFGRDDWAGGEDPSKPFVATRLVPPQILYRNTRGLDYVSSVSFSAIAMRHPQVSAVLGRLLPSREAKHAHHTPARSARPS